MLERILDMMDIYVHLLQKDAPKALTDNLWQAIINLKHWVMIDGKPVYIRDGSGKSKIENAFRNGANSKSSKEIVNTVIEHHESLNEFTPKGMKKFLENCGYDVKPLGSKSSLKGQRFEDGGGYRIALAVTDIFNITLKKQVITKVLIGK